MNAEPTPVVKICCIATIAEVAAALPPPTETFLLTALQLVDHVPHAHLRRLRVLCPGCGWCR